MIKTMKIKPWECLHVMAGSTILNYDPDYNDGGFTITYEEDEEYIGIPLGDGAV